MRSNLIAEISNLNQKYNVNVTIIINYCNLEANAILRSRLSANQKNKNNNKNNNLNNYNK